LAFAAIFVKMGVLQSNLHMDLQKKQKNPIFFISMDILQNTNFFRAFTASVDIPSIYVKQFWNTLGKDDKTGVYSFQLDKLWFNLNVDLLHNALEITPKDTTHLFVPPPTGDLIIDFVRRSGLLKRSSSHVHIMADDYPLNYLKFSSKGEVDKPKPKPSKKKTFKPTPSKKVHKGKRFEHLVDKEDEEDQPAFDPQDASTRPSAQPWDDTSANVVYDTFSPVDSTNDAENVVDMEQSNNENVLRFFMLKKNMARSDPSKTLESRPLPELEVMEEDQAGSNLGQSHVAQAGPNPKPMNEDFIATNLEDAFTSGDQFFNDKSTKEELRKANVETEVESMVIVPIHQTSSSVPPLSIPIIDLSPPKPVSPPKYKLQDKTIQSLGSRIYTLDNHDLYSKIDKQVNEVIKEAVHNALQAPLLHEALATSRKRRRDNQDPHPPPPKDFDRSKKKKHDSDVCALKQHMDQKSLAWKTPNAREAPSSSSKQKSAYPSVQPVTDDPIPEDMHLSE
nr:hypothetical protein [Tanacetum cinerariifolium]